MTDSHESVEEEVERALRLSLATAAQLADRLVRARQDLARQAQHRSQHEARQLESRFRAEGASATARLAVLDRAEWWDRATSADVVGMYELAAQWEENQPRAAAAVETIAREVHDRHGIDLQALGVGPLDICAALDRIEFERTERTMQNVGRRANTPAAIVDVLRAHKVDEVLSESGSHARGGQAEVLPYDSAERREQTASGMRDAGLTTEAIGIAMRADIAYDQPAAGVTVGGKHAARPQSGQRRTQHQSGHRSDRGR